MIHDNSLQAFHSQRDKFSKRAGLVYRWLTDHGPRTDRELARELGFGENLNAVRPRITELIEDGWLMEVCSRICPVTKKRVRVVDIRKPRQLLLLSAVAGISGASIQHEDRSKAVL